MVVDANAPDMLHQDEPDFGWLDEACDMKGDRLSVPDDEKFEMEKENEDEVQLVDPNPKSKERVSGSDSEREGPWIACNTHFAYRKPWYTYHLPAFLLTGISDREP